MNQALSIPVEDRGAATLEIARYVADLRYENIPEAAIAAAKLYMLDTLAVAWAGADAAGCPEARAVLLQEYGAGACTTWGWGDRVSAPASAFMNGMTASALDFDSLGRDAPSHVNVVVLPAALALAERERVSGADFLSALVAGCDLMCRLGAACETLNASHRGWFYTSVHGVFAAAAAAAKVLRLDVDQTLNAFGLAYSQAAGTQQIMVEPGLAKRMGAGFAARAGVFAALLAQKGLTAPQASIEGTYGLLKMYQPADVSRLLRRLGADFENANLSIKKFPSCACNHGAIEAVLQLVRENGLDADDVESVEVEISEYMNRLVGGVFEPGANPQAAAQFSIQYSIACALTRRRFGLAELELDVIRDPQIRALAHKVRVTVDPANPGKRGPVVLRVASRRHGALVRSIEDVPGSDYAPIPLEDVQEKARQCLSLGPRPLDAGRVELMLSRVAKLEAVRDMHGFFDGIF